MNIYERCKLHAELCKEEWIPGVPQQRHSGIRGYQVSTILFSKSLIRLPKSPVEHDEPTRIRCHLWEPLSVLSRNPLLNLHESFHAIACQGGLPVHMMFPNFFVLLPAILVGCSQVFLQLSSRLRSSAGLPHARIYSARSGRTHAQTCPTAPRPIMRTVKDHRRPHHAPCNLLLARCRSGRRCEST